MMEYQFTSVAFKDMNNVLNAFGSEGWQAVNFHRCEGFYEIVFARIKEADHQESSDDKPPMAMKG